LSFQHLKNHGKKWMGATMQIQDGA